MPLYKVALPAIGGFFAPLYWLSTLPRAADYQPGRLEAPDFLVRAVAMIGKFILIPLLLAYAAILLVYAVQIVITRQLPEGMLGWMVLGFVTAGAGAWLVLHPRVPARQHHRPLLPPLVVLVDDRPAHPLLRRGPGPARRLRLHPRAAAARLGRRLGDARSPRSSSSAAATSG